MGMHFPPTLDIQERARADMSANEAGRWSQCSSIETSGGVGAKNDSCGWISCVLIRHAIKTPKLNTV